MGHKTLRSRIPHRPGLLLTAMLVASASVTGAAVAVADTGTGTLDPRFGTEGVVSTATAPATGSDFQNGLVIDRQGRILVSGSSDMGEGAGGNQWRISRYTPEGSLDPSFGSGGTVLTSMSAVGGSEEHIWALALQADGKIVAVGHATTAAGGEDFALARYLPDGRLDPNFGQGGTVLTTIGPGQGADEAHDVRVLRDGRIMVAGFTSTTASRSSRDFALVAYCPDGSLDTSFGQDGARPGVVVTDLAGGRDQLGGMTLDERGRIVVVGSADLGAGRGGGSLAIARYWPDGRLDEKFGGGIVVTPMAADDLLDLAIAVAIDHRGRITVGGSADANAGGPFDLALARYNPDGSLDAGFGTGGKVLTNVGPGQTDEDLRGLVIQRSGKILIGGSTAPTEFLVDSNFLVGRYNEDGSLDQSFGDGGFVVTPTSTGNGDNEIFNIALTRTGKLVAAGECERGATGRDVCLTRYEVGAKGSKSPTGTSSRITNSLHRPAGGAGAGFWRAESMSDRLHRRN
ncbi:MULTISPECIES: hypothetical protein [unclassified Kitasatospora]|uniref:hypothetical protein n=1 Tax=unclassified Kitasatospora TaxID=2633591 RepID=UPI00070A588B|nr:MULTISPECIES: hypothetical protein [unclassified Kitasatospora]KQV11986.1 hypothetical protein ASC99_35515 [Kitasatospora sp. Root107]KRB68874.1 hypothetical protein ASE03_28650 [Kitasatospora sp. Root187]